MAPGDPFELDGDGDEIVAVLVHGFTGTPYEMSYLGEHLARQGIAVRAPLLPGHGTSIGDLDRTGWRDWAGAVERAVDAASARFRRVAVIGQSLGGLLALHVASRRPELAAVGSLAAPLWLPGWSGRIAAWTTTGPLRWISKLPKLGGSDVRDPRVRAINPSYRAIPTRALGELLAFMQVVDAELPRIACPVLVMHATHDHTAPVACAARIADRARAERVRILPRSYHLIAIDLERDQVADEVTALLRRHRDTGDISCAT